MSVRKTPFRCSDGMCGGDDCERCRPNYFERENEPEDSELDNEPGVEITN